MFWHHGLRAAIVVCVATGAAAFVASRPPSTAFRCSVCGAKGADKWKDEQMEEQYAILARRRNAKNRENYFAEVFQKRQQATKEQYSKWKFQREEGEDPIIAWKKLREKGEIGYVEPELAKISPAYLQRSQDGPRRRRQEAGRRYPSASPEFRRGRRSGG